MTFSLPAVCTGHHITRLRLTTCSNDHTFRMSQNTNLKYTEDEPMHVNKKEIISTDEI